MPRQTGFFGHPKGLQTLFFTEMWERFSYYGMRAFLIFYMTKPDTIGGLGFNKVKGGLIYGIYVATVYVLSLPGGWIADRFLGQRKAVFMGGVLIMLGHVSLAIPLLGTFYLGLGLIMLGTGLLKPNISTMVGQLYPAGDKRRDGGFSIYYMGINIGAFFAPLACGFLAQDEGFRKWLSGHGIDPNAAWHFGFGAAAVGMFFGLVQYVLGGRHLGSAGLHPVPAESPAAAASSRRTLVIIVAGVLAVLGTLYSVVNIGSLQVSEATLSVIILVVLLSVLVVLFVGLFMMGQWTREEKRRLLLIMLLCFGAVIFFGVFEQAGSTFNLFADEHTATTLFGWTFPPSYLQSVNSSFIILLAPIFGVLWTYLAKRGKNPSSTAKFSIGMFFLAAGCLVMLPSAAIAEGGGKAHFSWLILLYLLHTMAELCVSPVGLSSMTKLAPARIGGMVMGIWFAGTAVGNYLSGVSAGLTESMGLSLPMLYFVIALPPIAAGIIFAALVRPVRRMLGGRSEEELRGGAEAAPEAG